MPLFGIPPLPSEHAITKRAKPNATEGKVARMARLRRKEKQNPHEKRNVFSFSPKDGAGQETSLPRHRHKLTRAEVRRAQRQRIVRAAAEAVADEGYRAATVADIVRRAGVSTKTFYELFRDKERAILAIYDGIDAQVDALDAVMKAAAQRPPRTLLHAALVRGLDELAKEPAIARLVAIEALGAGPAVHARRNQTFRKLAGFIAALLPAAVDQSILIAYLGGLNELVVQHLDVTGARALPRLAPAFQRFTDALFFRRAH
jgi:AcrR family transcriptional regulator